MCMKPLPSSSSLIVATSLMQQQHQQSLSSLDNATPSSPLDTFKDAHNNQQQPHTLPHLYTALLERSNLAMVSPPPSSNPSPTTSDPQSIDMAMDDTASSAMPSPNDDTLRMGNDFIQVGLLSLSCPPLITPPLPSREDPPLQPPSLDSLFWLVERKDRGLEKTPSDSPKQLGTIILCHMWFIPRFGILKGIVNQ
ncbi:hypothetical protein BC829DRAFT_414229 [Chytridium lagenaria]|nr:hypothetical protein BC829DRAFT_414229 [Chytridium lagenaria]